MRFVARPSRMARPRARRPAERRRPRARRPVDRRLATNRRSKSGLRRNRQSRHALPSSRAQMNTLSQGKRGRLPTGRLSRGSSVLHPRAHEEHRWAHAHTRLDPWHEFSMTFCSLEQEQAFEKKTSKQISDHAMRVLHKPNATATTQSIGRSRKEARPVNSRLPWGPP